MKTLRRLLNPWPLIAALLVASIEIVGAQEPAKSTVDRFDAEVAKLVEMAGGEAPIRPQGVNRTGSGPALGGADVVDVVRPRVGPSEADQGLLEGSGDEHFWGIDLRGERRAFDLRFRAGGRVWIYWRTFDADGKLSGDEEPSEAQWEWVEGSNPPRLVVSHAHLGKAEYQMARGSPPRLAQLRSDGGWKDKRVLLRRRIELGFIGGGSSELKGP